MKEIEQFEITEDHLKLLKHFYVGWANSEYGAPMINSKRPYGNSGVEGDIAEILGWEMGEDSDGFAEMPIELEKKARQLHEETKTALQICLTNQAFETGIYVKSSFYDDRSWIKQK